MKRIFPFCLLLAVLCVASCAQTGSSPAPSTSASLPATAAPTPTQIPGRPELYRLHDLPEHLAYIQWSWIRGQNAEGKRFDELEELVFAFTIHNDVQPFRGGYGYYLMLGYSEISGVPFYFGVQTDVKYPDVAVSYGKGLIFSRWGTRDLANARYPEDGWTESAGHEGDFIGVRRSYAWGPGDYRVRLAPDESAPQEPDGAWIGVWITDLSTDETTWIGSLKFPLTDGKAVIETPVYTTMEFYAEIRGSQIRPIDIPTWHVSIRRPLGDGVIAHGGRTGYSALEGEITNSDIRYDVTNNIVHIQAGGTTERRTEPGIVDLW